MFESSFSAIVHEKVTVILLYALRWFQYPAAELRVWNTVAWVVDTCFAVSRYSCRYATEGMSDSPSREPAKFRTLRYCVSS